MTVSVVATVKDERASIARLLRSLEGQTRPPDEIVVVDGGSRDGTLEALRDAARQTAELVVVEAPGANIAEGRNIAVERASGPIIAVADAGTELDAHWLENLVEPLASHDDVAVSAGFFRAGGGTWFERTLSTVITPQLPEIDPDRFLPSSRSVAFRKQWWKAVGGYPEWLDHCEDLVFGLRLREQGAHFVFTPDASVVWVARSSLPAFSRQYYLYARGDAHAGLYLHRHVARYSAYALGAVLLGLGRRQPAALGLLALGMGFYFRRFVRRVLRRPPHDGAGANALALAAVPVIVVVGDVAKMIGYAAGRLERRQRGTSTGT